MTPARLPRWIQLSIGLSLIGVLGAFGLVEALYMNWKLLAPPVETQPMTVRHDARGSGHFLAPRSGNRSHRGVDLLAEFDSPVHAIRSGRVIAVGTHRGLGHFIELEHRGNLRSLYAHLNAVHVEAGTRVRQGCIIGRVGKSGNARHPSILPHLHLEVWHHGKPIDPQSLGLYVMNPAPKRVQFSQAHGGE